MLCRTNRAMVFLLLAGLLGTVGLDAAGPGGRTVSKKKKSWFTKTVTTTTLTGTFYIFDGEEPDSTGAAEYKEVTVVCRGPCYSSTTTNRYLTAGFSGTPEVTGQVATFTIQTQAPHDVIPMIPVVNGAASFSLSTAKGDEVPVLQKDDRISANTPMCDPFVLFIFETDPVTTVTTTGR